MLRRRHPTNPAAPVMFCLPDPTLSGLNKYTCSLVNLLLSVGGVIKLFSVNDTWLEEKSIDYPT